MPWPTVTFRTELPEVVRKELEHFGASIRAQLKVAQNVANTDPLQPIGGGESTYDLDYTGDYVARVYNDGDIVIGPDGIAYVCVKDGVTTPPEPWPGVGIATAVGPPGPPGPPGPTGPAGPGVNDATYWVSSPHASLTAERDIGALANGYVKSTVTDGVSTPSTVAIIPITDGGTGASNAGNARTNLGLGTMAVQNANAVAITGGVISAGEITGGTVTGFFLRATGDFLSSGTIYGLGDASITGFVSAAHFLGNGVNLTNLNASALASGTVATARLGSGAANAGTFLRGDQTWASAPGVPTGLIAIFTTACPSGWSRVAALDNRFPLGSGSWGSAGGASTHSHTASGSTSASGTHRHYIALTRSFSGNTGEVNVTTLVAVNRSGPDLQLFLPHSHPFSGSVFIEGDTAEGGDHAHNVTLGTDAPSHIPPYLTVVFCQKD